MADFPHPSTGVRLYLHHIETRLQRTGMRSKVKRSGAHHPLPLYGRNRLHGRSDCLRTTRFHLDKYNIWLFLRNNVDLAEPGAVISVQNPISPLRRACAQARSPSGPNCLPSIKSLPETAEYDSQPLTWRLCHLTWRLKFFKKVFRCTAEIPYCASIS